MKRVKKIFVDLFAIAVLVLTIIAMTLFDPELPDE